MRILVRVPGSCLTPRVSPFAVHVAQLSHGIPGSGGASLGDRGGLGLEPQGSSGKLGLGCCQVSCRRGFQAGGWIQGLLQAQLLLVDLARLQPQAGVRTEVWIGPAEGLPARNAWLVACLGLDPGACVGLISPA